jgi:hypothetical protein
MCGALVSSGLLSGARVCLRTAGSAHEAWQTALLWKEMTAADITIAKFVGIGAQDLVAAETAISKLGLRPAVSFGVVAERHRDGRRVCLR